MGRLITVRTPEGEATQIDEADLGAARDAGFQVESDAQANERIAADAAERQFGGTAGSIEAGIYGLGRGATLGLSDVILREGGADPKALSAIRNVNRKVSLGSEILGGVLPGLATGGSSEAAGLASLTPSGLLSRGASLVGEGIAEGGGAARAIAGATASGAIEGGIQNVGSYLSDVALDNKPLSAEGFVGALGQGALFGGGAAGGLAGIERGTIAARRMFPKLAGGGKEAAQIAEETFHAKADDLLKAGDELETVGRDQLGDLRLRNAELRLEKMKLAGVTDPAKLRRAEIAVEEANIALQRKALIAERNAKRAATGLPDLPETAAVNATADAAQAAAPQSWKEFVGERMGGYMKSEGGHAGAMKRISAEWKAAKAGKPLAEDVAAAAAPEAAAPVAADVAPSLPANDIAPPTPANANLPGEVAPSLHGSDDLMARLGATKQALDEGIPFTEIGKAENTLKVAADDASHEAHMLADGAVGDGIAHEERLAQKVDDYAAKKQAVKDYVASLKSKARQAESGREISYRPLQEGSDVLGVGPSKRSGKVVTPVEGREAEAFASDQLMAGAAGSKAEREAGSALDDAYESAIQEATKAATDDAQSAAIKRAGQIEDDILDHVAARGGRDAEQVAAIRKAREEIGWTSEQVAARRAEKRALAEMEGPTPARKVSAEDAAFDDALRASSEAMGSTQGERARVLMGDMPKPRGASVADEILAGGRTVDLRPMLERPSQGRLIDSAEQGIKVIGDFEKAHADLAQELGAAAPPAAAAHAAEYTAAVDDQARKLSEKVAMDADRASSMVSLGDAPKVTGLARLPKLPEGIAKRALDAAGALELLNSVGDLPFMPDVKDLPVVGPMLAMYLKFRGAKAVFNRFGGRIGASTDAKVAVRAAEMRDKVARIADELLEGAGKAAKAARGPVVVAGPKLLEVLNHSQYDDGQERGKPKNAAEATRHRVEELSAAASNPDAVRAAVRQQVPASNPDVVKAVEDVAVRKLQYLQSKAPKQPPPGPFRTREWVPSKVEMERFARRVRAADDPSTVIDDLKAGTVTPEAAETLREVYPQIFAEVQTRLITRAADLQVTLPHQKLVNLSLLFDAPLKPSLEPANLAILQSTNDPNQSAAMSPGAPPGGPPAPSVAAPLNMSSLYETPDVRRATR